MSKTNQPFLEKLGIRELNEMQLASVAAVKKHGAIQILSATGSGKTLAFLLPLLELIKKDQQGVQALIIVPSRELAIQIEQVFRRMSTGLQIVCCYGGHAVRIEKNNLLHPPQVMVGTPGRIAYHLRNNNFDPSRTKILVLDEFDKSLEFGFKEEMSEIIQKLQKLNKRLLTSATRLEEIPDFTGVKNPFTLNYLKESAPVESKLVLKYLQSTNQDKLQLLFELICTLGEKQTLVFCNHRDAVERISELLTERKIEHGIFHGGLEQEHRERELIKFRNGTHRILVSTDLASRGLDIPEIGVVVHYQLPVSKEVFTHRNGRTARMNADGSAYLLLTSSEHLPGFIEENPELEILSELSSIPGQTKWQTLYIGAGKKDNISKTDIVGMLLQKGKLAKDDLGKVEVLDKTAYAAVKRSVVNKVLNLIRSERIKNKKVKIEISK